MRKFKIETEVIAPDKLYAERTAQLFKDAILQSEGNFVQKVNNVVVHGALAELKNDTGQNEFKRYRVTLYCEGDIVKTKPAFKAL